MLNVITTMTVEMEVMKLAVVRSLLMSLSGCLFKTASSFLLLKWKVDTLLLEPVIEPIKCEIFEGSSGS